MHGIPPAHANIASKHTFNCKLAAQACLCS